MSRTSSVLVLFLVALFAVSDAMSVNLAEAVDAEMRTYLTRMDVFADKLHVMHRRAVREMKENHARMRSRRSSHSLEDLRHGFVPGTGAGNRESFELGGTTLMPSVALSSLYKDVFRTIEGQQSDQFRINKKQFLVTLSYNPRFVVIWEFNATQGDPLSEIFRANFANTGDIRLVGGSNEREGRVELHYDGVWGTICDDSWGINDANVVCRMLGYQGASGAPGSAQFGQGTGPIQLDEVGCLGDEQTIFDCEHPDFREHDCDHDADAGVVCIASADTVHARAMKAFTQTYYNNGLITEEKKIAATSDTYTIIIVANEDGTEFEVKNVTVSPGDVTDIDFFSIGVDSYLVFTRSTDDPEGDKSIIYLWSNTIKIFEVRQNIRTYGAQQVQAFEMTGIHYLLVIETNKESSIWRYNTRQSQFTLFQKLEDGAARFGLFFTDSYERYIVIITAQGNTSIVYHWDGIDFHKDQTISTPMASAWSTIRDPSTCQDKPLVALSSMLPGSQAITIYDVTDSQLVVSPFPDPSDLPNRAIPEGVIDLFQFTDWKETAYAVITYKFPDENNAEIILPLIFKLQTNINPEASPYAQAVETALQDAATVVQTQIDIYKQKVIDGEEALRDKISLKDGDLVIGGNVTFNGTITFNGTLVVDKVIADDVIVDNTVDGVDLSEVFDALEGAADENTRVVQALRQQFDDRVTLTGTQTITAHKTFQSLTIEGDLQANTITAPTINDVDIEALENSVVRNNVDGQTINGALIFENSVSVDGDLSMQNGVLVNGFNMADAVTETGTQTISGAKTFQQDVTITGNAVVQDSVTMDTVDVSEEVVTLAGTHTLGESITFNDVMTVNNNIVTSSTVDGVDVSEMDADTVRESGDVTITGPVTFQQSVTVDDDVTIGGTANDIDLSDFDARAVRHDVDTTITGAKTFSDDITIEGNLDLSGQIDGVDLFTDALLANSSNSIGIKDSLIEGLLYPYGADAGDLSIRREDDIGFVEVPMEQPLPFFGVAFNTIFVNLNGLLTFTGPVSTFIPRPFPILRESHIAPFWADVDITVGGDIYYRQIMNPSGDDVAYLETNRIICHTFRVHFDANWIFVVTWDAVAYFGSTSSITNTFQSVVASDGTHAYVIFNYGDINWTTGTMSGGSEATGLGGGSPAVVGVNAGDGAVYYAVSSSFTADIVNIEGTSNIAVPGRYVYEVGVPNVNNFLGQVITGSKTFTDELKIDGSVTVNGLTDGVNFDDVVTLSGICTIEEDKTFADGIMVQGDLHTSGTVDGVDVSLFASQVMTITGTQQVAGDVTFESDLTVEKNVVVDGTVDGVDIRAMEADAVYANEAQEQVITAPKTFTAPFSVGSGGSITFTGTVNTHDVETGFMDLTTAQSVTGTKTFTDGFTASSDMSVGGTVDGVTMSTLWAQAALITESETLAGTKSFAGTMSVTGDLTVGGDVNTVDLSSDVMMVDVDQVVTGAKTFACFVATGNLQAVDGDITYLNGEDWTDFVDGRATLSTDQTISGDVIFANEVTVNGNIATDSLVNGINLPTLSQSILYKTGAQTITGAKTFTGSVEFDGAASISGTLDGVNIEDMLGRAIYLNDGTQSISAKKTFTNALTVSNDITVSGDVNGINLADLNNDIVWTNAGSQTVTGKKIFNDGLHASQSITVTGTVNDVDISEEVLTLTRAQTITGSYTFDADVDIGGTLTVSGVINDVNIQALDADAMKIDEVQTVTSPIVFENDVSVTGDITVNPTETVDTVDLSELQTIAKFVDVPFTLPNAVAFELPVTFDDALRVTGTVHGYNLQTWAPTVLTVDGTQTVTGDHTIEGTLTAIDIGVPVTIRAVTAYGINVDGFVADAVRLQGDKTITGSKTFLDDVTVEGSITVAGTVDGVDLSAEIVTLDGAQTIFGAKTFDTCDVKTAGNILISGTVNDIEISQEEADTLDFRSPKKVEGHKSFTRDASVAGNMQFNGLVDDKDITRGLTLDTEQTVTAYYVINQKASVTGDVTVTGLVNTVNLANIDTKRITLTGSNTVDAHLTFNDMVILEDNVTTAYLFDGVDLSELGALEDSRSDEFENELYELACFAETQCERTESIVGVVNNFIDAIDYVENVQIIGQHVRQFHPFSLDGQTFMAAAIYADEHGDVCTDSIIYQFNTTTGNFQEFQRLPTNGAVAWEHFFIDDEICLVVANAGHTACQEVRECPDPTGVLYRGTLAETINGHTCQSWTSQSPHKHDRTPSNYQGFGLGDHNYCRNPDGVLTGWCYTTDSEFRWEYCAVGYLSPECQELRECPDPTGDLYRGTLAETINGRTCQSWTSQSPHKHDRTPSNYQGFGLGDHNYCRNPDGVLTGWCYTTDSDFRWEYCAVGYLSPECQDPPPVIFGNSIYGFENGRFILASSTGDDMEATSDVATFVIDGENFLVFTTYEGDLANVYKYNKVSGNFQVFQDITTGVTSSVECVLFDEMVFLVFTLYLEEESAVYRYNSTAQEFELFQKVESEHARVVTSFNYQNTQGFALADHISVSDIDASFEVQVRVYTWNAEDGRFDMTSTLPVVEPGDVDIFTEGNFLYMCVVQEYHSVDFFRYEGSAGFVKFYEIPHHGVRSVEILTLQEEECRAVDDIEYEQLFIAVAVDPFPKHDIYSRLLKVVNLGGSVHVTTLENMCDSGLKDTTRIDTPEPTC